MKLIVITPSNAIENEHPILGKMLDMGLPSLYVRKPKLSKSAFVTYLNGFTKEQQKKIIIHKYYRLLLSLDLKGIHVSKRQRKKKLKFLVFKILLRLLKKNCIIGTSCESLSSLPDVYEKFDYITISPVFKSLNGHLPGFNMGALMKMVPTYPEKIIARGGTDADSIDKVKKIGFAGITFQEYIWDNPEPLKAFQKILDAFREQGLTID